MAIRSGGLAPAPPPPREKAAAARNEPGQAGTDDRARNRVPSERFQHLIFGASDYVYA
jgi:hypothetical protein